MNLNHAALNAVFPLNLRNLCCFITLLSTAEQNSVGSILTWLTRELNDSYIK
jgi:hypothetical protein